MLKEFQQSAVVQPGGVIRLTATDLPEGTPVKVTISPEQEKDESLTQEEKWERFYAVLGAWKDDEDINQVFAEIERDRRSDRGRETPDFDT